MTVSFNTTLPVPLNHFTTDRMSCQQKTAGGIMWRKAQSEFLFFLGNNIICPVDASFVIILSCDMKIKGY
jgi:hypothetical protein